MNSRALRVASTILGNVLGLCDRMSCFSFENTISIGFGSGRQENDFDASCLNRRANTGGLMAAQVVHNTKVTRVKSGGQQPLTEAGEGKTVNHHCGSRSVQSDRVHKRIGIPTTGGNGFDKSVATKRPSSKSREVGLQPGFVNEDNSLSVCIRLARTPDLPLDGNIFAVLFCCPLRLFSNELSDASRKAKLSSPKNSDPEHHVVPATLRQGVFEDGFSILFSFATDRSLSTATIGVRLQ
jgi:hypothetical protein